MMANIQIPITDNGTKVLKTAGKYCDRDIEINVNVPTNSGGITPSGTKSISQNGQYDVTNYATVDVNVPTPQPTQFTNLLTHPSTELRFNVAHNGTARAGMVSVIVDLIAIGFTTKKKADFRARGLWVDFSYASIMTSTDKTSWSAKKSMLGQARDSHGDSMVSISSVDPASTPYLLLSFRNLSSTATADNYAGSILTINEPIGNGGYVG